MNRLFNKIALLISIFVFVSCGGNDTNKSNTQTDTSNNSYNSNSTNTTVTANLGGEGFENLAKELKITQSISHNGVCLTVINVFATSYSVCVVKETIDRTKGRNRKCCY